MKKRALAADKVTQQHAFDNMAVHEQETSVLLKKELEDRQAAINNLQVERTLMQNRITEVSNTNTVLNDRLRVLQANVDQDKVAQEKERILSSLNMDKIKKEKGQQKQDDDEEIQRLKVDLSLNMDNIKKE